MVFNSLQFALFFIIFFPLYVFLSNNHRRQNWLLLTGSYIFYGAWDWRFLSLLFISTCLDYWFALRIDAQQNPKKRKSFLILSIVVNLGILGFFKYFNFFIDNLQYLCNAFNLPFLLPFAHVILPIGVSFYTFQSMSYVIDVYRREIEPTRRLDDYAIFVSFFPHLVAGPIMRAGQLLTQVVNRRQLTLEKFYEGSYLIFWGLFQKVFVADNLAKIVDQTFKFSTQYNGIYVLLGLYAFAFQIYCDFAGYSNIARGLGKCLGFEIVINFNLPYFAKNPSDFWKRWHISLSTWLKDYLYISLGGNRRGALFTYRNLALTMLLGGLWHGAAWTFVLWGAYHGFLLVIYRVIENFTKSFIRIKNIIVQKVISFFQIILFFHLICFGWLIFRAESLKQLSAMLRGLMENFIVQDLPEIKFIIIKILFFTGTLFAAECIQYLKNDQLAIYRAPTWAKVFFYVFIFLLMLIFGVTNGKQFIYFQF